MREMTDAGGVLSRLAPLTVVGAGLTLLPAQLPAQEVAREVEFDRLWSHDTGG